MLKKSLTIIGCVAILLWSLYALVDQQLHAIPITQVVIITFCIGSGAWLLYLGFDLFQVIYSTPRLLLFASVYGIGISPICYLWAFRFIPPEQVDLITYL